MQLFTAGVQTLQVTLGAGTTQVTTNDIPCRQVMVQNNATHNVRVGDLNTSSTRGAVLLPNSTGSINFGPFSDSKPVNLNQIWLNGTAADVIDVVLVQ